MPSLVKRTPDVRIQELDLGQSPFQASDFASAYVITSSQGPVGPTRYRSPETFISDFGKPNEAIGHGHNSVLNYFKGGNDAWIIRAVHDDARYAAVFFYADPEGNTKMVSGAVKNPDLPDFGPYIPANGKPLYCFTMKQGPGSYADDRYALQIRSTNVEKPTSIDVASKTTGGSFSNGTQAYRIAAVGVAGEGLASDIATIVITSTTTTNSVELAWSPVAGAIAYNIYGRDGSADTGAGSGSGVSSMGLIATVGGGNVTWFDDGLDDPDLTTKPILLVADLPVPSQEFTIDLFDLTESSTFPIESHTCTVGNGTDSSGLQTETVYRIGQWSEKLNVFGAFSILDTANLPSISSTALKAFAGGTSGSAPTNSDRMLAWNKFIDTETYRVDMLVNAGDSNPALQTQIDYVSRKRFDCIAFLDTPTDFQKAQQALDYRRLRLNLNSSFSALFTSDLYISDPYNGKATFMPPSGIVAGLLADTARNYQPWYSFAGLNRGQSGALDVRYTYDDTWGTELVNAQVNYFAKFLSDGIPLWTQQTLYTKETALAWINVRVLLNVIKRGMKKWLRYQLQEPNDPILMRQVKAGLETFLEYVTSERGVRRSRVTCSYVNNKPIHLNAGRLQVRVLIEPTLAVNAIELTIGVGQSDTTFDENIVSQPGQ